MVASIGAIASAAQGVSYYAKDDPEHRQASAWSGKGAGELGLEGAVDPQTFRAVLEGKVPDGSGRALGRRDRDGKLLHPTRPRRHPLGPEIRLARRARRRRCPRRRRP